MVSWNAGTNTTDSEVLDLYSTAENTLPSVDTVSSYDTKYIGLDDGFVNFVTYRSPDPSPGSTETYEIPLGSLMQMVWAYGDYTPGLSGDTGMLNFGNQKG